MTSGIDDASTLVELCFVIFDIPPASLFAIPLKLQSLLASRDDEALASAVLLSYAEDMLRISTLDTADERRLVVEGTLANPWVAELRGAMGAAGASLEGRSLVIDLTNATTIDREGEAAIFELMQNGVKFCCSGVHTKHVLKKLAGQCHTGLSNVLHRQRGRSEKEGS